MMEIRERTLSDNLKRIRTRRNLSLEAVAGLTGVSRSMLAQIERGESNPTVSTINKITAGLRIDYEELLCPKKDELRIIDPEMAGEFSERPGKYRTLMIFPYEQGRSFEQMKAVIEPGQVLGNLLPGEDMNEYVSVISGDLVLRVQSDEYTLVEGMSARIPAGNEHVYCNRSSEKLILMIIFSKE
ncbi:MAG: helix-turn-helix domain-containing protein [Lachnospiraceae bacterium]|nr:helix-turn-helix domain-containing protein [Lachnospiraceae bacterium]